MKVELDEFLVLDDPTRTDFARRLDARLDIPGLPIARTLEEIPEPPSGVDPNGPHDRFDPDERAYLAETLERALIPHAPPVAVLDNVRKLAQPGASVVVCGQQPGLAGGPLFCAFKALHTLRLARSLEVAWERPVVPLYWNHADDHDLAEVNHTHLVNENLDVERLGLSGTGSGRQPLSRIHLSDEHHGLGAIQARLRHALGHLEHFDWASTLLLPREGETLATALTRAFTELFGPLGLVVLEPDTLRPAWTRALADTVSHDLATPLQEAASTLRTLGLTPAVEPTDAALVYRVDESGRTPLRLGGEGYRYDEEPGSRRGSELAASLVGDLEGWSAGALLRPIVQDLALPVAAYIGGDGEAAYQALLGPLRTAIGAPTTPFVCRFSATVLEEHTTRSLEKSHLDLSEILESTEPLIETVGRRTPPPAVLERIDDLSERTRAELLTLTDDVRNIDPALIGALRRTASSLQEPLHKLREKLRRVHANRHGIGRAHLRRLQSSLRPLGHPQERIHSLLPLLARHGPELIPALLEVLPAMPSGLGVVSVRTESTNP